MAEDLKLLPTREQLIHALYEAAELEHNLMCTYLYAAFSLKDGEAEGLSADEAAAVKRWRRTILDVAIEEMGHLAAVWNITAAVGGAPRFGRVNFPIDAGYLPAGIVVKLAPFNEDVLQHFIHLERPKDSTEPDGEGFHYERNFKRNPPVRRLTPMGFDYETVGEFYDTMEYALGVMTDRLGEKDLFCGDPALQLSANEIDLEGAKPVLCKKTAIQACEAIVTQGEGASAENPNSHFCRFRRIRDELTALKQKNPGFEPAFNAAVNPVLRRPPDPDGHVWIEDEAASAIVDVANASYQTMLRLLAYSYVVPGPSREKSLAVDLSIDIMKAFAMLGESAARRPSGSRTGCNAGVSFTALRDSAPLPHAESSRRFFVERMAELVKGAERLDQKDQRVARATGLLKALAARARQFEAIEDAPVAIAAAPPPVTKAKAYEVKDGVEHVVGEKVTINYTGKLCIHSRYCVTQAPRSFLANVEGPWIHPDDTEAEELAAVARNCPSGAIQYVRNDGAPGEQAPPVNLVRTLQDGPNAWRGDLRIDGKSIGYRATLCRCGASKNKPYCDGSHHDIHFEASGEPATGDKTAMLAVRDGPIEITPQIDGPLMVRGNMEIISGTGRVVARVTAARFCRCGHSQNKPFCDDTHKKVGFKSTN
ncbi:ferritin-like domain-containing protein [Terricaulis sp.]|uniref:ferritin-like domain-containing protein n=1 Tax=Terricaulis sp. TaxID=2768686 RepID=UPI00378359E9